MSASPDPQTLISSTVADLFTASRPLAYVVTDEQLRIRSIGGEHSLLAAPEPHMQSEDERHRSSCGLLGAYLWEVVPEIIGFENTLHVMASGGEDRLEIPLVNRNTAAGDLIYVTLLNLPFTDRAKQSRGILHIVEDKTREGRAEQNLQQERNELDLLREHLQAQNMKLQIANAELQEAERMKDHFVAFAVHELRNPLMSASGYADLLAEGVLGNLTPTQLTRMHVIQNCLERLNDITNNLLDATLIETGRIELVLHPHRLDVLLQHIAVEFEPLLAKKEQRLRLHIADDLPPALCDELRATQILTNLLSNASKYSQVGSSIRIDLRCADEDGFLQVSVADQGMGITLSDLEHLFERFFRSEAARERGEPGVGLGLNIVRALVELHGGRIWVESKAGAGSTFYVTFPIEDAQIEQPTNSQGGSDDIETEEVVAVGPNNGGAENESSAENEGGAADSMADHDSSDEQTP